MFFTFLFWKNSMLTEIKTRKRHNLLNLSIELKILNWTRTWKWKSRKKFMKSKQLKTTRFSRLMKFQTFFFDELDLYYLIEWKDYENAIWKFVSLIKHFRKILRQLYNENSKKFNVNKKTNHRKFRKKWNEIFIAC